MTATDQVNILLVDDQPAKLVSYEAILAPLGENLIKASSGREALEHLLRREIAVVLVDVCMPDLDGFELAALIRDHPRHRQTAIIFVSAVLLTDFDRLRGYECGGVDYVSVPVEPEILRARVSIFADLYRKTRQLERLNRELEERVAERTAELTSAASRLRDSEAALREADRRKDEFLAMLAHELRNPLAPISNAVEILRQRSAPDGELRWGYELIDRQVGHLTRLVDDLLDVSRITRGKLEIRPQPADLAEIVRGAAEAIQPCVAAKGLRFHVAPTPRPIPVQADVVRLSQVVLNLLDNACKFTPKGGSVWLAAELAGGMASVRVKDSGAGIPAEDLPKLFQMFHQSRRTGADSNGGLGIGLALVRRLVELHGGSVEARSGGPGLGSEFVVLLPTTDQDLRHGTADMRGAERAGRRAARRILVVDDNLDSADSLAHLLRGVGNDVRTAYDGPAAAATAESFRAEVVLLDIGLPRLDGFQVARQIREQPWGKDVTLIALTGWGQEHDRLLTKEAGFDAHLTKPVDFAAITALLDHLAAPSVIAPVAER